MSKYIKIVGQKIEANREIHYFNVEEFLLNEFYPKGLPKNTQVILNDKMILTEETIDNDLKLKLTEDDTLVIVQNPEDEVVQTVVGVAMIAIGSATFGLGIAWLVSAGVGVALGGISQMLMDKPELPQAPSMVEAVKPDEVFTTSMSQIRPKLGEMIPVGYGTFKKSPDLLSEYTYYHNNNEYKCLTTCLGWGQYDIEETYIGDTKFDNILGNDDHYQAQYIGHDKDGNLYPTIDIGVSNDYRKHPDDSRWNADIANTEVVGKIYSSSVMVQVFSDVEKTLTIRCATFNGENSEVEIEAKEEELTLTWNIVQQKYEKLHYFHFYSNEFNEGSLNFNVKVVGDLDDISQITSAVQYITVPENVLSYTKYYNEHVKNYNPKTSIPLYNYEIPIISKEKQNMKILDEEMPYMTIAENKTLKRLFVNFATNGIYNTADDGTLTNYSVDLKLEIIRVADDERFSQTFTISTTDLKNSLTKNTPIMITFSIGIADVITYSAHTTSTLSTTGILSPTLSSDYKLRVTRVTAKSTSSRVSDEVYLKDVIAFEESSLFAQDKTLLSMRLLTTDAVATSSQKNITLKAKRTFVKDNIKNVITDIFTNSTYGGGMPSEMLNLPDATETFNHCFTSNQTILEAVTKTAISGLYMLKPSNGISLEKIATKPKQFLLTSDRISDLKISGITKNPQMKDGFRVFYRDNEYKEQFKLYPTTASYPNEVKLLGCSDSTRAEVYAKYLHLSETKKNQKISFHIEKEGEVLEIYSRGTLSISHISTGWSGVIRELDGNTITTDDIVMSDLTDLQIVFHNDDLAPSATYNVTSATSNTITLNSLPSYAKVGTPFHIGKTATYIKDIEILSKTPSDGGWDIEAQLYSEEVF